MMLFTSFSQLKIYKTSTYLGYVRRIQKVGLTLDLRYAPICECNIKF